MGGAFTALVTLSATPGDERQKCSIPEMLESTPTPIAGVENQMSRFSIPKTKAENREDLNYTEST